MWLPLLDPASTGRMLKAHENIVNESVPFNMEADSLNCCVLGDDVNPGDIESDIYKRSTKRNDGEGWTEMYSHSPYHCSC